MSWIWLVILLFFLVFFGGIFFMVNHNIQIQKKALQTIYQEQYAMRMEVTRLARSLDSLLADREVSDLPPPAQVRTPGPAQNAPAGMDQLLLNMDDKSALTPSVSSTPAAQKAAPASSLDLKM